MGAPIAGDIGIGDIDGGEAAAGDIGAGDMGAGDMGAGVIAAGDPAEPDAGGLLGHGKVCAPACNAGAAASARTRGR
jgi:hypothetical protein